jgi:hypothetical protein
VIGGVWDPETPITDVTQDLDGKPAFDSADDDRIFQHAERHHPRILAIYFKVQQFTGGKFGEFIDPQVLRLRKFDLHPAFDPDAMTEDREQAPGGFLQKAFDGGIPVEFLHGR